MKRAVGARYPSLVNGRTPVGFVALFLARGITRHVSYEQDLSFGLYLHGASSLRIADRGDASSSLTDGHPNLKAACNT